MNLYFSYGIEMSQSKMRTICNNARIYGVGKCLGYRFSINSLSNYTLVSSVNAVVYGILWEISNSEMEPIKIFNTPFKERFTASIEIINPAQNERISKYTNKHLENHFVEAFTYKDIETTYGSPKKDDVETILSVLRNNSVPQDYIREISFWVK
ncbi:MAG: gamma-glutamylcyclotransferase [Caldisericia bacterium]|nr:gamma-glutamylcyclotransferase [Caldisericia bacterium]